MSGSIYDTTRKQYELLFILRGKLRLTSIDFFFLFVDNKTGMGGDSSLQVVCWWRFWLAAVSHLSIMLNNSFTVKRLYLSAINWTPKIASLRKEKWKYKGWPWASMLAEPPILFPVFLLTDTLMPKSHLPLLFNCEFEQEKKKKKEEN